MKNHHDDIYLLAKYSDKKQLWAYIEKHQANIDELQDGTYFLSPAARLAKEGNFAKAKMLLELGASSKWVILYAATAGHLDFAEAVRKQCVRKVPNLGPILLNALACGAAEGNNRAYAEILRKEGASIDAIAQGAAMAGNTEYVEELRRAGASVEFIVRGFAIAKNNPYTEAFRYQYAINTAEIAYWAAAVGNSAYAMKLFSQDATFNIATHIARGAARGRNTELAEKLRHLHNIGIDPLIGPASLGGHVEYVKFLKQESLKNFVSEVKSSAKLKEENQELKRAIGELTQDKKNLQELVDKQREQIKELQLLSTHLNQIQSLDTNQKQQPQPLAEVPGSQPLLFTDPADNTISQTVSSTTRTSDVTSTYGNPSTEWRWHPTVFGSTITTTASPGQSGAEDIVCLGADDTGKNLQALANQALGTTGQGVIKLEKGSVIPTISTVTTATGLEHSPLPVSMQQEFRKHLKQFQQPPCISDTNQTVKRKLDNKNDAPDTVEPTSTKKRGKTMGT